MNCKGVKPRINIILALVLIASPADDNDYTPDPATGYGRYSDKGRRQEISALPNISNPYNHMWVDSLQLYVTDATGPDERRTTVHVYSLPEARYLFSFGGDGEGPGRFVVQPAHSVHLYTGHQNLIINSGGKVSMFNRAGELIRELRHQRDSYFYQPFGDGYAGRQIVNEDGRTCYLLNLYDSELNFQRELARKMDPGLAFSGDFFFQVYRNRIFMTGTEDDLVLHIYNLEGEKSLDIRLQYVRIPVSEAQRSEHFDRLLNRPGWDAYFDSREEYTRYLNQRIRYPEQFPAVMDMMVADGRIYLVTYDQQDGLREVLVLDPGGNMLSRQMVPFRMKSELEFFPFTIGNGLLYQLIPSEETGEWYLYTTPIKQDLKGENQGAVCTWLR